MRVSNQSFQRLVRWKSEASVPTTEKSFIANTLYRRFYRLPEGVKLRLDSVYHRFDNTRTFTALGDRYDKFARFESVRVEDWNATIHFLHDPSIGDKSGLRKSSRQKAQGQGCKLHRGDWSAIRERSL